MAVSEVAPEAFVTWLKNEHWHFFTEFLLGENLFAPYCDGQLSEAATSELKEKLARLKPAAQVAYLCEKLPKEPDGKCFRHPTLLELEAGFEWHLKNLSKSGNALAQEILRESPISHEPAIEENTAYQWGDDISDARAPFRGELALQWYLVRRELYVERSSEVRDALVRQLREWGRLRRFIERVLGATLPGCLAVAEAIPERLSDHPKKQRRLAQRLRAKILGNSTAINLIQETVPDMNPHDKEDQPVPDENPDDKENQQDLWRIVREVRDNRILRNAMLRLTYSDRDSFFRHLKVLLKQWKDDFQPGSSAQLKDILVWWHQELRPLHGQRRVKIVYTLAGRPTPPADSMIANDMRIRRLMNDLSLPKDPPHKRGKGTDADFNSLMERAKAYRQAMSQKPA